MLAMERDEWLPDGGRDRVALTSGGEVSELVDSIEPIVAALPRRVERGESTGLGTLV